MEIQLIFDTEHIATISLDGLQDSYPWYRGGILDGPAMNQWRDLVEVFGQADLEFDYCPHHPDEGAFEDTDLAAYVEELALYHQQRRAGRTPAANDGSSWSQTWSSLDTERLATLIEFVDYRRWTAVTPSGSIVAGIPLPPALDLHIRRFAFRPC